METIENGLVKRNQNEWLLKTHSNKKRKNLQRRNKKGYHTITKEETQANTKRVTQEE